MSLDSRYQAEWRLIYALVVAGKSAKFAERVLAKLFPEFGDRSPFEQVRDWISAGWLLSKLREAKSGTYGRLERALEQIVELDAETCSIEELEAVHGIGPKTARFFLLWTRPGVKYAALDVHVLKFLNRLGFTNLHGTPPAGKTYAKLERIFIGLAEKIGVSARELDVTVWRAYRDGDEDALFADLAPYGIKETTR
jgi:thermostable 8-oxoguanine DNA glycosylase